MPAPLALLLAAALAAPAGHYHPDNVAAKSRVFASAAEASGPAFEAAQDALGRVGRGLAQLEIGAALLGDRAPAGFDAWATGIRRTATGQYLRLQKHVDLLGDDYSRVFGDALTRAVAAEKGDLVECTGGSGIQALMRRPGATACPGEDRNGALARRIDADAELSKAVAAINAVPFPEVGVEPKTWAPATVTGAARWFDVATVARKAAGPALERDAQALEAALAPLESGIDAGDAAAVAEAERARAAYEAALATHGAALLEAAAKALDKAGLSDVGACPNPASLGGCAGADATKDVLAALLADKKFVKVAEGL